MKANGGDHRSPIGEWIHGYVTRLSIEFEAPDTVLWMNEPYVTEMSIASRDGNHWVLEFELDDRGREITLHAYIHWTGSHEFALRGEQGPEEMTLPFFPAKSTRPASEGRDPVARRIEATREGREGGALAASALGDEEGDEVASAGEAEAFEDVIQRRMAQRCGRSLSVARTRRRLAREVGLELGQHGRARNRPGACSRPRQRLRRRGVRPPRLHRRRRLGEPPPPTGDVVDDGPDRRAVALGQLVVGDLETLAAGLRA